MQETKQMVFQQDSKIEHSQPATSTSSGVSRRPRKGRLETCQHISVVTRGLHFVAKSALYVLVFNFTSAIESQVWLLHVLWVQCSKLLKRELSMESRPPACECLLSSTSDQIHETAFPKRQSLLISSTSAATLIGYNATLSAIYCTRRCATLTDTTPSKGSSVLSRRS